MELIPLPLPRALTVVAGKVHHDGLLPEVLAALALRGPLSVLDGANKMPVQRLLALLRLRLPDPLPAARGVSMQRAFTCHQVHAMLAAHPAAPQPVVLIDPLATFYDDNVPLPEAAHLLGACLAQIDRLRLAAGVLAFVSAPLLPERLPLFERFCAAAGTVLTLEEPAPAALQPALF